MAISRRISIIYHKIFVESPYTLNEKPAEFWDEFFMLKPRAGELQSLLRNCDAEILHFLTLKCIEYVELPRENAGEGDSSATTDEPSTGKPSPATVRPNKLLKVISNWDS